MASEKITVTIPVEVLAPIRRSAGKNLSAYVTRALRNQLVQEAMVTLEEDMAANPALRVAHGEWLEDMDAEQDAIATTGRESAA